MKKTTEDAIKVLVNSLTQDTLQDIGALLIFNKPTEMKYIFGLIEIDNEYLENLIAAIDKHLEVHTPDQEDTDIFLDIKKHAEERLALQKNEIGNFNEDNKN
ncbi:hypothetical protein [Liquorilactobacillus hordei]|uniref:Uncharacterized protein n=1 Tax=Liquorilactobacillus hordei DSM 19519 TaxID=1423759 RepID=A0A0R1MIZ4_9LACO|nr:hypothetical protein [Liquorilactobacillus hordei]KRL07959.1 hypothetical protein FC92_GL001027 [Liquorilactobacillus hordei DSM 19519]QYH51097.1 hypothetical protein G6O70_00615 [Liquorilactobacillus hordei DSM 19519]